MYYLIINASPRRDGNSSKVAEIVEDELVARNEKVLAINLFDLDIGYCHACGYCNHLPKCRIDDDMNGLYRLFDQSKGTIVISPVYFDSVPGKLKSLIDRTQVIYASKYVRNDSIIERQKPRSGMIIGIGGADSYEGQFAGLQIPLKFLFRCINTKLEEECYVSGTDQISVTDKDDKIEEIRAKLTKL